MSAWTDATDKANNSLMEKLGEPIAYSREADSDSDAVEEFAAVALPGTAILFTGNNSAESTIYVRIADIPEAPQKGDFVTWRDQCFVVQEIPFMSDGLAGLGLRTRQS